ncbi:hypothetical protein [Amycolatopsis tucumanensis]|uniref:Uncharacterized protein n=1 Tax=Amycolatopsis tucumanensis TaxID=401106 RepID=A0ABP7HKM7_9PSEU|nr:hypothetical protein [Amycolatopsis tucumanensis]MCF6423717.1 hypothetical protein [Amycolatopsis tucumanensis]
MTTPARILIGVSALAAGLLTACDSETPAPPPPPSAEPGPATVAFADSTHIRFADASGRVWGSVPVDGTPLAAAWSADGQYFAWLGDTRLHIVEAATGTDRPQPCPCSGLARLSAGFATAGADGSALLLFDPRAGATLVPLTPAAPYTTVVAGGREEVVIAQPVPEEIADYRGQSTLLAVGSDGRARPMIEGTSRVSMGGASTAPDDSRVATIESPSSGACWNVPGIFVLGTARPNPASERMIPGDGKLTEAVLTENRIVTDLNWAGGDTIVTFGPSTGCQVPHPRRYLTYALSGGEWTYLRDGALAVGYGGGGRTYAIELGGDQQALTDEDRRGSLILTTGDGQSHELAANVTAFWTTVSEQAAGRPVPKASPEGDTHTSDHGAPVAQPFLDLAGKLRAALDSGDIDAVNALCAECDEPTRTLLGTPSGREQLGRALRTHPAVDEVSATFPGLATAACVDTTEASAPCTAEQIHDAGVLGLTAILDIDETGNKYAVPVGGSIRFVLEPSGEARWTGQSTSAKDYAHKSDYLDEPQYFFLSTDGAYLCGFNTEMAACQGETEPVPPRPESCPAEGPGWGYGMYVDTGRADFLCSGGVMFYPLNREPGDQDKLALGQTIAAAGFACTAEQDGVSCRHEETGHGFLVAAHRNQIF